MNMSYYHVITITSLIGCIDPIQLTSSSENLGTAILVGNSGCALFSKVRILGDVYT